jgi:hypothetical protein
MSKMNWTVWLVAIGAWGLYSCWHLGYQSGYADGHETAWKMYQPSIPDFHIAAGPDQSLIPDLNETRESDRTR